MTRSKISHVGAVLAAIAVVVAVAAFAASPALAAKGGTQTKGGGKGHGGSTPAATVTITVSPNPVPAYTQYTLTFSNLLPDHAYNEWLVYPGGGGLVTYLGSGTTTITQTWTAAGPGTYSVAVIDVTGGTQTVVGSLSFEAY